MRLVRTLVPVGCIVVAVVSVVWAWARPRPDLTETDALHLARRALTYAGLTVDQVSPHATKGLYHPANRNPVPVWKTSAAVRGGRIDLWFYRDLGQAVYLVDRAPNGASFVTDTQFRRLGQFHDDVAVHRRIEQNIAASVAAAGVAVTAAWGRTIDRRLIGAGR